MLNQSLTDLKQIQIKPLCLWDIKKTVTKKITFHLKVIKDAINVVNGMMQSMIDVLLVKDLLKDIHQSDRIRMDISTVKMRFHQDKYLTTVF